MQTVNRLTKQFIPSNYILSIELNRKERTFSGTVLINGSIQTNSKTISLHSKDLEIKSVLIDGKQVEFSFGENDEMTINYPTIIDGEHEVSVTFYGKITDSMNGVYPCYYEHEGVKKELIATQFESHHAREVFPCIDEPEAKATFDVTLTTEKDVIILGNMPIKDQLTQNDRLVTTFETTPIMSSYLLAWVVGELHKKTAYTKSGVEVNVWATPAQSSEYLDFALDIATRSIEYFDEYFGTPYPLPKSDHVALPDFSSGAMENWGLVTYREIALLVDPATTSIAIKHHVALVIAHELSHQWFGNLVTMKWWNDLWLNESFASLVEYSAVDALEPDWNIWLNFASDECIYALRRDRLDGVQPVQTDVNHPDEISTLFDGAIVYAKGSRLLKMLQRYIGDEAFKSGLKEYFKINAYKNTEALDLWSALSNSSGKDIASLMNVWISQPGYPVVYVSKQQDKVVLYQEKLASKSGQKSDTIWPIPLNSNCSYIPEIMKDREIVIDQFSYNEPLRLNTSSDVHFITHYDRALMDRLVEQIKVGELPVIDRFQLLHEQTILASVGLISSAELIPLVNAYGNETAESVWDIISMTIGELKKFVENDSDSEKRLRGLTGSLARMQYTRLGWNKIPNETETDTKLRSTVISLMLYSEDQETISTAIDIFNSTPIDELNPELRCLILSANIRYGDNGDKFKSLIENYKITDSPELKQDICIGLTSTIDSDKLDTLIGMLKETDVIRTQDTARWIIYLMRNKYGRQKTWQWVRDNWNWINDTFSGDKSYNDYPRYVATLLSTPKQLDEYLDFFTPLRSEQSLTRNIDIGINEIKDRVDVIERDGPSVKQALLNL